MKNVAIILGAGKSTRCGFDKILREHQGATALEKCIKTFSQCDAVDDVWVVLNANQIKIFPSSPLIKGVITGGKERFFSVKNAIEHCEKYYDENVRLIFHNAANPNLSISDLESGIKLSEKKKNIIFGYFTSNSIKQVLKSGLVSNFLDREQIFETQTPQISDLETFTKAKAQAANFTPKDEAELLNLIDEEIFVYECDPSNVKITYDSDFTKDSKIGLGEDAHRFSEKFDPEKPFRLGGVDVSGGKLSSDGNSDGDLILHGLCNALLSAYGDKTFDPIAAPLCEAGDTNSESYLKATLEHLSQPKIHQVLISLEGVQPKIAPHHDAIQENLSKLLNIEKLQIGLTYTTGESLSEVGKGLGVRAFVLVIIK